MFKGSKNAFTLAEVLITLGIIGVVAAMTMPTLMNSTQGAQYRTGFKKAISVLSQAVVLNIALDDYDTSQATTTTIGNNSPSLYNLFYNRMNVSKVMGNVSTTNGGWPVASATLYASGTGSGGGSSAYLNNSNNYVFFFNDGMVLSFPKTASNCGELWAASNCKGFVDMNGIKNPNRVTTCQTGNSDSDCKVVNPQDVYPIRMYGQTIAPNSVAARQVMYGGK